MRSSLLKISLVCITLGIIPVAHAAVDVTFVKSDRFIDIGTRFSDQASVLKELQKAFQKTGDKYVTANQTLKIEILDVDLAGRDRLLQPPRDDVRVVTGRADWPSIKLHYTLTAEGKTLKSGEETMADLGYRDGLITSNQNESLYYEKQMIEIWFQNNFAKAKVAGQSAN